MGKRTCTLCDEPHVARGYCGKHYQRWSKHGDPLIVLPPAREGVRRYTLNESYFDEMAAEEQAYWLGFITADGGIIRSGRTFALRLELAEIDGEHVRRLADALGSNKPVCSRPGFVYASFDSWRLVECLERLGLTPRKSATVEPWNGPADLMPHYWRGLFDGDGSIGKVRTRTDWCLSICGSRACVEAFADWAMSISGGTAIPHPARKGSFCWRWAVTGGRKAQLLADALYGNATVALPRKRETAALLRAIDFGALKTAANVRRAAAMREAWATGRHPRATLAD